MRKLSYKSLLLMNHERVLVHDLQYDCYNQVCEVRTFSEPKLEKSRKNIRVIIGASKIQLFNEEYLFEFDNLGNCINGEFEVFSYE